MEYSRDYFVHYYEVDANRRLTLPSLVKYFEDVAILHSASRGFGLEYYAENHCVWLLMKWSITIHSLPVFGETVRVSTGVHALKRFLADRVFSLVSADGVLLAEGRSNWVFIDTERRRPVRVPDSIVSGFSPESVLDADFVAIPDVLPIASAAPSRRAVCGSASDIDTNGHVNNVSYLNWAVDSLPHDFSLGRSPRTFSAQYRKELAPGAQAEVITSADGNRSTHTIFSEGEDRCVIAIDWA